MQLTKIKDLLIKRHQHKESASTLILYVLWMPLLVVIFGLAVDVSIATYTQASLQSGLDAATQSSLSRAVNPGVKGNVTNSPYLTTAAAHTYFNEFYDINRSKGKNPFIVCQTSPTIPSPGSGAIIGTGVKLINPPSRCDWTETNFKLILNSKSATLNTDVFEESHTTFIYMIGVPILKYNISSVATSTYAIG